MEERGAVSVEFAAVLPLIAVCLLLVAQVGLLVSEQLSVQHAAREGARVAAITNDDESARAAALQAGHLDPARAEVDVEPDERTAGTPVTVSVAYRASLIPLADRFIIAEIVLRAAVQMRTERASP